MSEPIEKTLSFIREHRKKYAKAKADRVYLEQFRKSKKAILIERQRFFLTQAHEKFTEASLENYAYANPEYLEVLEGLRAAVEQEEEMAMLVKGCWMQIEIWRTEQANNRQERGAYQ